MNCYAGRILRVAVLGVFFTIALITGVVISAVARNVEPEAKKTPTPFGEMKIAPASLAFKKVTFGKTADSESKSFSVEDIGTAPLTVTVGKPATSEFTITQGAGQTTLQKKGSLLSVTVLFAPGAAGTFRDSISVTSNATRGKASASVKLSGAAKGTPPTPTATATPSATPTPAAVSAWPMFHDDPQHTGLSTVDTSADTGTPSWIFSCPAVACTATSPVLAPDGTVYLSNGFNDLYAINTDSTAKWVFEAGKGVDGTEGLSNPATAADGTIYVAIAGLGNFGGMSHLTTYLYALDSSGTQKWVFQAPTPSPAAPFVSPTVGSDGTVYVVTTDGYLYAVTNQGDEKWAFLTTSGIAINSSPAIGADGTIYLGADDHNLYAIASTGSLKWKFPTLGEVESSPALASDGTIYVGSDDDNLYALNPDGTKKWSFLTGGPVESPSIAADGTVYVGSADNNFYALNPPDGSRKWEINFIDPPTDAAIGKDGTVYVGSSFGFGAGLFAFNPDGTQKWASIGGLGFDYTSPAVGPDGTIYIDAIGGDLYAIH